jgi:hypothetical protein
MRIIRLTESDLTRIVKTVIKEQELMPFAYQYTRDRQANKTTPAKENINPKNLKVGDGGQYNPDEVADVKKLQQKLIDLGFLNIKTPTGYFGDKTQTALDAYNKSGATGAAAGAESGAAADSSSATQDLPFKNRAEGNAFRKWFNDKYRGTAKESGLDREGSYNNAYIKNAFNKQIKGTAYTYGKLYMDQTGGKVSGSTDGKVSGTSGSTPSKPETKPQGGFIIIFAFPTYKPSLEKGDVFSDFYADAAEFVSGVRPDKAPALGHGGCVVIESNGNAILYEFGRYGGAKEGHGIVKSANLGKIAKIENGKLMNAQEVAAKAKAKTQNEGPQQPMDAVVYGLPNPSQAISYANVKEREYDLSDMSTTDEDANCGTFAVQVARAGGAMTMLRACVPAPGAMVQALRPLSLQYVQA